MLEPLPNVEHNAMGSSKPILLKIGEVAAQSGVPIKTIRYYEQLGLLTIAHRTEGNFRLFNQSAISRLAFIKRLQALGLSLQEIGECLTIYDDGCLPCENIQQKLQERVSKIDLQVSELMELRGELTNLLQEWSLAPDRQDGVICPNLEV